MTLQPGCPLVVAPSFHLPIDWARRLQLAPGIERVGDGFSPRLDWRAPDEREQGLLAPTGQASGGCLCLFQIPRHLFSAWWRLLEQAREAAPGRLEGFDRFVADVAGFLTFKDLPVPEGAAFDLLVSKPGLRSIRRNGAASGLTFNLAAETPYPLEDETGRPRLWGGLNLGDEATSLLFVNLLATDLLAEVRRRQSDLFSPCTHGELAERFLTLCADYPPVRLRIEPGEGFRLPKGGLLVDGCTLDKSAPDVLLLIRC
ncbi:MAG TPA: hypothetical protein VKA46_24885 [Gemmataceae bacterium]|nr:hypothetical protein [Gemmataceae bacterium]